MASDLSALLRPAFLPTWHIGTFKLNGTLRQPPAAGACEDEISRLCAKVEPGEGRLEDCLTHRLEEEEEGDAKGGWALVWVAGWVGGFAGCFGQAGELTTKH